MKAYLYCALFTSLFFILVFSRGSLADSGTDPGVLMYKAGHLEQAKQYFEAEAAANPKSASTHYMLANVLVELKQIDGAEKEYHLSAVLDPYGSTGQYSRLALTRLAGGTADKYSSFASGTKANLSQSSTFLPKMIDSVRTISREVSEDEKKAQAECDEKVRHIYELADDKTKQLQEEMSERIAGNGQPVYSRVPVWSGDWTTSAMGSMQKIYDPEPANEAIRKEINPQIDKIKLQARQEADRIIAVYKEKAMALENSAVTLDKSYINNKPGGSVSLMPAGTNMYLRNYQTADSPSGNPVPVMAAPPKLLPGILPDSKNTY